MFSGLRSSAGLITSPSPRKGRHRKSRTLPKKGVKMVECGERGRINSQDVYYLNIPNPISQRVEPQLVCYLSSIHSVRQVLKRRGVSKSVVDRELLICAA